MSLSLFRISSVIRWLLVVAGCVVLETAQPAFAAEADPLEVESAVSVEEPTEAEDSFIFPRGRESREIAPREHSPGRISWVTWLFGIALLGGGAWIVWQKKQQAVRTGAGRKIQIEETRPMGNRQYLVVARCEGKRFLLGVTPGRIDVVSPLDGDEEPS